MHIAVAQMADDRGARARIKIRQQRIGTLQKNPDLVDRYGYIVDQHRGAGKSQFGGRLAARPHLAALAVVLGNHGVPHHPLLQQIGQHLFKVACQRHLPVRPRRHVARGGGPQFHKDIHRVIRLKGRARAGMHFAVGPEIGRGHVFKRLDLPACGGLKPVQDVQRAGQRLSGHHRGDIGTRLWHQFQHRAGDDAQRAL